jgi:hypothetical protein
MGSDDLHPNALRRKREAKVHFGEGMTVTFRQQSAAPKSSRHQQVRQLMCDSR